ncbi:PTS glucose transporter subunit IIBC [Flavonifractor sp. An92]|uniref:N-acetylglucosamine-specific PTS transporter subunit IIBC n=1 Tax=Flavonifractor sp. An92 TaxID=1965666 RepID=UPI000B39F0FF|nr:N-acetylglucosamine-specific PTS transporter subunit IIBC [Flavonifractor sp. An92]OUN07886.1 PTS glucose transporter subunit IIBC [Flavonifractor sp. An92]
MMRFFQRLGKSLMLPVACLPIGGLLMGIGYWIDPSGWGANNLLALLLIKSGGILIDNMAILFALGVAIGMSKDQEGTSALAAIISWLTVQTMLGAGVVQLILGADATVPAAFTKINNQFIGILCGLIAAGCYNRFYKANMPDFLGFFAGRRFVPIMTVVTTLIVCIPLYFVWPVVYSFLVGVGETILGLGPVGAGIYGFLNRLLIPVGLHHALNSVFWFDVANISDINRFWGILEGGVLGQTGQYQAGFFPVMMFGLPGAALAMYHTAKTNKKKVAAGILMSAALCSFFTGVTEPLEFSFMFLAPALYVVHAILTGISVGIVAALPVRAGFQFSAGFVDWFLSFKAPFALNPILLIPIGVAFFVIYYVVFRALITAFNFKTPGREDDDNSAEMNIELGSSDYAAMAKAILEGVGGAANVTNVDNCITRLRLEVKDRLLVDEKKIKAAGAAGVVRPGKTSVQVIIGPKVQFVADEFKKLVH